MRCDIQSPLAETAAGAIAAEVLRACVHCGMCNAVCPTYQIAGDELDGPRGRIYLIKQALEGEPVGRVTQVHLDRCLSCRACESACPSGVEYHRLFDIGREAVAARAVRPWTERAARAAILTLCARPRLLRVLLTLAGKIPLGAGGVRDGRPTPPPSRAASGHRAPPPPRSGAGEEERKPTFLLSSLAKRGRWRGAFSRRDGGGVPATEPHPRRMAILAGCAQSAAAGHFNAATARVFDRVGISLAETPAVGCCGALAFHLDAPEQARAQARCNIDAWTADLDAGAEAIVVNASGCAAFIRDYPDVLAADPAWIAKARRVAAAVRDPIEILDGAGLAADRPPAEPRIAVHEPCTLRNGPRLTGRIGRLLASLGYEPQPVADAPRCCGSAGAYSLLQPALAGRLRADKLAALIARAPSAIYTANIGCWLHLGETAPVPVRHWIEAVDAVI